MANPLDKIFYSFLEIVRLFWQGAVNFYGGIINWFLVDYHFFLVKVFFGFLDFFLFIGILILVEKTGYWTDVIWDDLKVFWLGEKEAVKKKREWKDVQKLVESDRESDLKMAVIEADKILDSVLKEMRIEGENVFEKLKNLDPSIISNLSDLKKAHLFRNKLIHEGSFKPSRSELKAIISIYEQALRELGYL